MVDALNDLRRELTNALRSVWKNLPTENAPQADALPDDVVEEIATNFYRNPKNRGKLNEDKTDSLPMLARIRSRGLFEDDWRARPTEDRPWPVVLVHGTGSTKGDWQDLGADLRRDGWAVFAPEFGQRATSSVAESSAQIGAYIDTVLLATGASKVIVVGHSQGGVLLRYWMRVLGGASKVKHMVSLAVPNHGTTMGGIVSPLIRNNRGESVVNSVVQSWFGEAGFEMIRGHDTINAINEGGDLDPDVTYLCIATHFDTVIQPPETCFLEARNPEELKRVQNIWVENLDPNSVVLHEAMPYDPRVRALVRADLSKLVEISETAEN